MITEASNTTLKQIAEELKKCKYVQICGHANPDGDCIGSQLALKLALEQLGVEVDVLLSLNERPPKQFCFLPGFDELIFAGRKKRAADGFVMIDVPNDSRLGFSSTKLKKKAKTSFTIDHHFDENRYSDFSYCDPDSASTTLIVWELIDYLVCKKTKDIANCCLTGLMTDTGNFQYQNTDVKSFEYATQMVKAGANPSLISENVYMKNSLASLLLEKIAIENMEIICEGRGAITYITKEELASTGGKRSDCDRLVDLLRALDQTEIVAVLREDEDQIKVSLRSLLNHNVRDIAAVFGGGGHVGAAGASLNTPLLIAVEKVKEEIANALQDN